MDFFVVPTVTFRILYVWFVIEKEALPSRDGAMDLRPHRLGRALPTLARHRAHARARRAVGVLGDPRARAARPLSARVLLRPARAASARGQGGAGADRRRARRH